MDGHSCTGMSMSVSDRKMANDVKYVTVCVRFNLELFCVTGNQKLNYIPIIGYYQTKAVSCC